jgi:hypothetical protein
MDIDILIANQIQKEARAYAAQARLLRQMGRSRAAAPIAFRPWIGRLGEQMITWGQYLRAHSIGA